MWGACPGLAVAFGPITGRALLEQHWSGSTSLVKVPIALLTVVLARRLAPDSRDAAAPRLAGAEVATESVGAALTVAESPDRPVPPPATLPQPGSSTAYGPAA